MNEKIKNTLKTILIIVISSSISVGAASLINSKEVVYDNAKSGLESETVQGAVDELYSAATNYSDHEQRLIALEQTAITIDKVYPKGSIYMSTEDDTVAKVEAKFGGEWERYAQGRTLVGVGTGTDSNGTVKVFNKNESLGEYNHTLTVSEMPRHKHLIYQYANNQGTKFAVATSYATSNGNRITKLQTLESGTGLDPDSGDSVDGLVNADYAGGSTSHNNVQPYITVYMYKRIN